MMEKQALYKLEKSFNEIKPKFKESLERQMDNIHFQVERQNKLHEMAQKQSEEQDGKEKDDSKAKDEEGGNTAGNEDQKKEEQEPVEQKEECQVDTDKIKAMTTMVDEFNNIVAKNFSVYGQYDDFSFANSRSADDMEEKLNQFFGEHFSGDFQLKNSFETSVHPRIFYLEQRTKFIYSYKILNFMTQAIMIANNFNIADHIRYIVTPKGNLFVMGGYNPST